LSKDEAVQAEAVLCFGSLARKCESGELLHTNLVRHLFSTLAGNEHGKLTTSAQKSTVLSAIGQCSTTGATLNVDAFASILQLFTDYLRSEATTPHEPTLLVALTQLNLWLASTATRAVKLNETVQKRADELFKTLLVDSKALSTMHQVRASVYNCMATVYTALPAMLTGSASTFPALFAAGCLQVVDKAAAQHQLQQASHNNVLTTEALAAARVLTIYLTLTGDLASGIFSLFI
jgi:hypothetical protein